MAGLGMNSLPSQALSDSPDVGGCYQVGTQNSQGSVPGEWEGWGLGINLVLNFLGSELPGLSPVAGEAPANQPSLSTMDTPPTQAVLQGV